MAIFTYHCYRLLNFIFQVLQYLIPLHQNYGTLFGPNFHEVSAQVHPSDWQQIILPDNPLHVEPRLQQHLQTYYDAGRR